MSAPTLAPHALYPSQLIADAAWTHPYAFAAVVDDVDAQPVSLMDYRASGKAVRGPLSAAAVLTGRRAALITRQQQAFELAEKLGWHTADARVVDTRLAPAGLEVVLASEGSLVRVCSVHTEGAHPTPGARAVVWTASHELVLVSIAGR